MMLSTSFRKVGPARALLVVASAKMLSDGTNAPFVNAHAINKTAEESVLSRTGSVFIISQLLCVSLQYSFASATRYGYRFLSPTDPMGLSLSLKEFSGKATIMSCLIEGLPDAVALHCLARVPFYLYPQLQLVCRSWKAAIRSPELFNVRLEVGAAEEFLCVSAFEPENLWQLYDPRQDAWMTLPPLPSKIKHLSNFGAVSVGGKLFVLGGNSDAVDPQTGDHDGIFPTNEVWSYDPILQRWSSHTRMLVARAMFACCVLNGQIIVAGGFTDCRKSISRAERYDPEKDLWEPIADLQNTHNSACTGVVISEKFHVLHKGLSTVQMLDYSENRWVVEDYGWLQGPMAMVGGELYVFSHGMIKQQVRQQRPRVVAPATDFQSRIGFAVIGLGDDLYVIGGVDGPGQWNLPIKLLSDVDVLDVRSERPTWRKVSPMTLCHGTVVGCTVLRI